MLKTYLERAFKWSSPERRKGLRAGRESPYKGRHVDSLPTLLYF